MSIINLNTLNPGITSSELQNVGTLQSLNVSGNVGIGTTVKPRKLTVKGSDPFGQLRIEGDNSAAGIEIISNDDYSSYIDFTADSNYPDFNSRILRNNGVNSDLVIWNNGTGSLDFYTNSSEKMTILSNGNVGIGTTNPAEKLDVNGVIKSTTTTKAWVNFDGVPATPTIRASYNVSSVTKLSTGRYRITYTTALTNSNYAVSGIAQRQFNAGGPGDFKISVLADQNPPTGNMTTTFVEVETGPNSENLTEDAYMASVIIFNT